MSHSTLRSRIAESSLTLPTMAVITFLLWALGPWEEVAAWGSLAVLGFTTYAVAEWNSQCQLLRIRSRMVSVAFLALTAVTPALHAEGLHLIPAAALLGACFVLFKAYGIYCPEGHAFHAFLLLSLGSLVYPPLLLLAPTLLLSSRVQLRLLAPRSLVACILGLTLPYWLFATVVATGYWAPMAAQWGMPQLAEWSDIAPTWDPWLAYFEPLRPDYTAVAPSDWARFALIVILGLSGITHFISTSYNDKIRTRQYYYTVLVQLLPVLLLTAAFPADAAFTLPLLAIGAAPFVAHHLALARGGNGPLFVALALTLAVGVMNHLDLWTPLLSLDPASLFSSLNPVDLWKSFIS